MVWAGIAMMTVVAGLFAYFGWWTKAGLAAAVGVGMIVLAQTLPAHGPLILFGGVAVFALAALLILYSYYEGQLDQNQNGIPEYRMRAGDWRALFEIAGDRVIVYRIQHRREAYR